MCGISGFISDKPVTHNQISRMNDALAHRGPDDEGVWVSGNAGLGHRRLAIIDLSSGQQPMSCNNGALWISFNGEIYNYKEIRQQLSKKYHFNTNSDTEVLLNLYLEKGEACVNYLRGMFSFAIYDIQEKKLFIARDHLGQKPLYYWHQGQKLAFASEIKALLALNDSLREINPEALGEYFSTRIITPPRSMFKNICKLPPAHTMVFQHGHLQLKRYWVLDYKQKISGDLASVLEQLDRQVSEAVSYNLTSDVPVGAYLSGGMDSGMIVAVMNGLLDKPFATFSGDVPYKNYSELPYARQISQRYGTDNNEFKFIPSLVEHLPSVLWHLDEPSDCLSVAMYCLSKKISEQVKVVLGGDGGDELFGGYDRYYGNIYASYLSMIPLVIRKNIVAKLLRYYPDAGWYQSSGHKLKWLNTMSMFNGSQRYAKSLSYFYFSEEYHDQLYSKEFLASISGFDPEFSIKHFFDCDNANQLVDKMLYSDAMVRMPDHPVMVLDRMTMAHGLESRAPFLDHKLTEFCATIPPAMKIRGRQRRYIQARLARRYLPRTVLSRKKQGFASPVIYLLKDEFERIYRVLLKNSRLVEENFINGKFIARLLDQHLNHGIDHGQRLWLLCNAELWYRMYIDGVNKDLLSYQLAN